MIDLAFTPKYTSASLVYNLCGISATEVNLTTNTDIIEAAEAEVDRITGQEWDASNTKTEHITIGEPSILYTTSGTQKYQNTLVLKHYPISAITEFKLLDNDGTLNTTYDTLSSVEITAGTYYSDDYWVDVEKGIVRMMTHTFPQHTAGNEITITYTYGGTTVPYYIKELATCFAGIRAWTQFLGGKYDTINSWSLPETQVNKGDIFQRGKQMIDVLSERAKAILEDIGVKRQFSTGVVGFRGSA